MIQDILKPLIELKYNLKQCYQNYKESRSTIKFVTLYISSIILVATYFWYVLFLFIFAFLYVTIFSIFILFWQKKSFNLQCLSIYNLEFKNSVFNVIKYYFVDLLIQYSYVFVYLILKTIVNKLWLIFIKSTLLRSLNILFILIFGLPSFLINTVNKIYVRLNNSIEGYNIYWNVFLINLNSMFFFDFQDSLPSEQLNIYYKDGRLYFN